jgi:Ran GTPase-activating protein (RanGAP) involved in mRNA processing and transport
MLSQCVNYNLLEINLANNSLEDDGVRAVKEFLWENTSLKVLNINNCKLDDKSCKLLAECVDKNKKGLNLKKLHIAKNVFTDAGMELLCKFITKVKTLEDIDVSDCIKLDRRKPFKYEKAM